MRQVMDNYHKSVLLHEAIELLDIQKGKKYIDATLGGGGHTFEILQRGGKVLSLDTDEDAIAHVEEKIKNNEAKIKSNKEELIVRQGNFRDIDTIARENGFEKVSGILFDLGVSSHQLDVGKRGFSIAQEGPLDMRMTTALSVTAKDLVNGLTKSELTELFEKFGEEHFARKIASYIVDARRKKPIETTKELADLIKRANYKENKIHPATRVFQALRIAVNDELHSIREALPKALSLLEKEGRIVVISFHSLEDRIVKHTFSGFAQNGYGEIITDKPIIPSENEVNENSRARSAKLRVFKKLYEKTIVFSISLILYHYVFINCARGGC